MPDDPRRFASSDWELCPDFLIRSAGFPAGGLNDLADPELAAETDALADHTVAEAAEALEPLWRRRALANAATLADIAGRDDVQLALTWQNRAILASALGPLRRRIARGGSRDHRMRQHERLIASYWQRYCAKNDSIGFFGPAAWGTVSPDRATTSLRVGSELVGRAEVLLEAWPVEALAGALQREFGLDRWLRPRRNPTLALRRGGVQTASGRCLDADATDLALLAAASGTVTAEQLVRHVCVAQPDVPPEQLFQRLAGMRRRGWLIWRIELPAGGRAEDELRAILEGVTEDRIRQDALNRLDRLTEGRLVAQKHWNDAAALSSALDDLDRSFAELTGRAGTRRPGMSYAGRTTAYLECSRQLSAELGRDILAALEPLPALLDASRWLTHRIAERVRPWIAEIYRTLRTDDASAPNAAMLWAACAARHQDLDRFVAESVAEYHAGWSEVLAGVDTDAAHVRLPAADFAARAARVFAAPGPGWPAARWCSPDVMIAADPSGGVLAVVGEIHPAMNTTDYACAVRHHTDPSRLLDTLDRVHPGARFLMGQAASVPPRLRNVLIRACDHAVVTLPHLPPPASGRPVILADIAVNECEGSVALDVGDARYDAVELFEPILQERILRHLKPMPAPHRPRITVDSLVIARETWTYPVSDILFATGATDRDRFIAARRWWHARQLPRYVFATSPAEPKPVYVDADSPILVELLSAVVRRLASSDPAATLTVTEMLPTPGQLWLADQLGRRYTSEIRFVFADGRPASV